MQTLIHYRNHQRLTASALLFITVEAAILPGAALATAAPDSPVGASPALSSVTAPEKPQPQASAPSRPPPATTAPLTSAPSSTPASAPIPAPARTSGIANIGYLDGSQLSARCSRSDPSSSSYCFAYLAAVTDTTRAYEIWLGSREFCLPGGISQAEIRRAFMTYVSAYPAQGTGQAASVVINALKQTYPCD